MRAYMMQIRQGKPGGGKGPLVKYEHAPCLGTSQVETLFTMEDKMETETFTKGARPMNAQQPQTYELTDTAKTLNTFNNSEGRAEELIATKKEITNGNAEKARPGEVLLLLRKAIGTDALLKWVAGEYARLHPTEVLQPQVLLDGTGREADADEGRAYEQIPYTEADTARAVCDLWEAERERHSSQGPQSAEQRAGQLDSPVSQLPLEAASPSRGVQDLWETVEGTQLVQHALAAIQEVGRSADGAGQPVHEASDKGGVVSETPQYHYAVRRITPICGERLQGFADGWTRPCFKAEDITDKLVDRFVAIHLEWAKINGAAAKPKSRKWVREWLAKISGADCPDGPRYKAIGNSMSVNVMYWIGARIAEEDKRTLMSNTLSEKGETK